jgi:hypothetical protein
MLGAAEVTRARRCERGARTAGSLGVEANSSLWIVLAAGAFAGLTGDGDRRPRQRDPDRLGRGVHVSNAPRPTLSAAAVDIVGDQSSVLSSVVGLPLHAIGDAPGWTADVLTLAGPLLAFPGAALFMESVVHPPATWACRAPSTPCVARRG